MDRLKAIMLSAFCLLAVQAMPAQAQTAYYGEYILTISITVSTAVPTGGSIACGFHATTSDASATEINETVYAVASGTSGTVTCTLAIPYEWVLTNASGDVVSLYYDIGIFNSGQSVQIGDAPIRSQTHWLPSVTGVPASGTHTSLSASTRI